MLLGRYLPSVQFTVITLSLLVSGGLVYGAERYANPPRVAAEIDTAATAQPGDADTWEAALYAIQAANASTSLTAPNPETVEEMLAQAQSTNVTDTVGKSILINLSNAKSQGLGDDIPTQDQILSAATAQIEPNKPALYTTANLSIVDDSSASLRAYGNGVIRILNSNPEAGENATLLAVDGAIDKNDPAVLKTLAPIGSAYEDITSQLLALPVPKTLSPLHLTIVNAYATITASYPDMEASLTDPLRGIVGIQTYEAQLDQLSRVFTSVAQDLSKDGILFTKDEPGSAWSAILSP